MLAGSVYHFGKNNNDDDNDDDNEDVMITTMTMAGSVCFGNNDDGDDNLDKGDDYDNEIVIMVMHDFLTVPPDFQYQNGKQVAANQDYFFKKFSM